jgi:hypothetical protein
MALNREKDKLAAIGYGRRTFGGTLVVVATDR